MSIERIAVDKERIAGVIGICLEARQDQTFIFSKDIIPPEERYIGLLKQYSQEIGDDRFLLNALFLTTTMVFASNTQRFFRGISNYDQLEEYSWIFMPEIVVSMDEDEVKEACRKFLKPAGYSQNALKQWVHNCKVLTEKYDGDLRNFFSENSDDAIKIIRSLEVFPRAHSADKKDFRRYGPKLSRLFLQWVQQYELYSLENADEFGLPIDFQVARIIIQTGGLRLDGPAQAHSLTYKVLLPLLISLCSEKGWEPKDVSNTLWSIGNNCCNTKRHDQCPVNNSCEGQISRKPYDKDGMFEPVGNGTP